jgi:hypothetical protein
MRGARLDILGEVSSLLSFVPPGNPRSIIARAWTPLDHNSFAELSRGDRNVYDG